MSSAKPSNELVRVINAIIRREMALQEDQTMLYNQRWKIPPDDRLYVTCSILGSKPYGVNRSYSASPAIVETPTKITEVLNENISVNAQDLLSLKVFSKGDQARIRRNEILMALNSTFAEQEMERLSFRIGAVPISYVDASEEEGTTIINRYVITYAILYAQSVTKPVPYWDEVKFAPSTPVLQP